MKTKGNLSKQQVVSLLGLNFNDDSINEYGEDDISSDFEARDEMNENIRLQLRKMIYEYAEKTNESYPWYCAECDSPLREGDVTKKHCNECGSTVRKNEEKAVYEDVEHVDEFPETPQSDDIVISSNGWRYNVGSEDYGHLGTFEEWDDAIRTVKDWMEENQHWPQLWFMSDHGNYSKIDAEGNVIDEGLWDNIHAKRKRGEAPAKPGDEDYPKKDAWEKAQKSESYQDYLDTHYSTDGLEDFNADRDSMRRAEKLYDKAHKLFNSGKPNAAEKLRKKAIAIADFAGWGDNELPPFNEDLSPEEWDEANSILEKAKGWVECKPSLEEAEYKGRKVKLNKPMRGDVKKFKVYVKNDKGNVVKVNFGQKGVKIKKNNPKKRKSFRARHNCDNPGPKWKARYWSCKKW